MSIHLTISAQSDSIDIPFGSAEFEAIKLLSGKAPRETETVLGVDDLGKPRQISADLFLDALSTLQKLAQSREKTDDRIYYLQVENSAGGWSETRSGMSCAIEGRQYRIRVGKDVCTMEEKVLAASGLFEPGEKLDIRSRRQIMTDRGRLRICCTSSDGLLLPLLEDLRSFAQRHRGQVLEKIVG